MDKTTIFKAVVAFAGTFVSGWLGGWDAALQTLIVFMIADYVTGLIAGYKKKDLNSEVMFWGGIRKGAVLLVILIAVQLDALVGNEDPIFRTMAIYYYVAREGLSVTENLGNLGLPLPPFLKKVLSQLDDNTRK